MQNRLISGDRLQNAMLAGASGQRAPNAFVPPQPREDDAMLNKPADRTDYWQLARDLVGDAYEGARDLMARDLIGEAYEGARNLTADDLRAGAYWMAENLTPLTAPHDILMAYNQLVDGIRRSDRSASFKGIEGIGWGALAAFPGGKLLGKAVKSYRGGLPRGAAPDRTDSTLLRAVLPKGASTRARAFDRKLREDPKVMEELRGYAKAGEKIGRKWYNTEDLRDLFIEHLGEAKGDAAWREFLGFVGATSPGVGVYRNIRIASHYFKEGPTKLLERLQDLLAGRIRPPYPYGHGNQKDHARNVGKLVSGRWGPNAHPTVAPKSRGYSQALKGSQRNTALDRHFMRLIGMMADDPDFLNNNARVSKAFVETLRRKYGGKVDRFITPKPYRGRTSYTFHAKDAAKEGPDDLYAFIKTEPRVWGDNVRPNEYKYFEDLLAEMAADMDMTPAQLQASLWIGAADRTGVDPKSRDTFVNIFKNVVADRAAERGLSFGEVIEQFMNRQRALSLPLGAGLGGAVAVGASRDTPEFSENEF